MLLRHCDHQGLLPTPDLGSRLRSDRSITTGSSAREFPMPLPSRTRLLAAPVVLAVAFSFAAAVAPPAAHGAPVADDTPVLLTPKGEIADEFHGADEAQEGIEKLRDAYYWSRLLSGDSPISVSQAAGLRSSAAKKAGTLPTAAPAGATRGGAWSGQGPAPIVQNGRTTNA